MVKTSACRSISSHAAGSRRRQNQELERPLGGDRGLEARTVASPYATAPLGSPPHVLDDVLLPPEGPHRRHRAVDRQEDVRHCGVPVDAFLSVHYPYDRMSVDPIGGHSWPSPKTSRNALRFGRLQT